MVEATAASLATGSDPGKPRHTGHVRLLAEPPKATSQPQNILDRVDSSAWISRPTVVS
jgi:hypothetical protein